MNGFLLIFTLLEALSNSRKVLLFPSPIQYAHSLSFSILAQRISDDPLYECYIVLNLSFNIDLKNLKCKSIYLADSELSQEFKDRMAQSHKKAEEGMASALEDMNLMFLHKPLEFSEKNNLTQKIETLKIDLVICDLFNYACNVISNKLKIPRQIYFLTMCLPGTMMHSFEPTSSYIPIPTIARVKKQMNFFNRFINLIGYQGFILIGDKMLADIVNTYLPEVNENPWQNNTLFRKEAIYVQSCWPVFNHPELLPPNVINSGPLFIRESSPVDEEISLFLSKFKEVIYVSFGTYNVYDIKIALELSLRMPGYGFIASYRGSTENINKIPENLLVLKWVKQIDLLATRKIKAFITHAGCTSVMEAIFNEIPMIACGWSLDRDLESFLIEERGLGVRVKDMDGMNAECLEKAILEVVRNERIKENLKRYSSYLRKWDGEGKIKEAVDLYFEVGIKELVISEMHTMNWVQFYNIDVWLLEVLLVGVVFYLIWRVLKAVIFAVFKKIVGNHKDKID